MIYFFHDFPGKIIKFSSRDMNVFVNIIITFFFPGEFTAFLVGANLVIDYVLSNAAAARSFTTYLGTAIGVSAEAKWRINVSFLPNGFNQLDIIAVLIILILTLIICYR